MAEELDNEKLGSLGVRYIDEGKFEDALVCFNRCIEMTPNDERGWGGKACALFNTENYKKAMDCCKKALELNPKFKKARDILGAIYYKDSNYESLLKLARETLRFYPDDVQSHLMVAEVLALNTKLIEAETELKKALASVHKKEYVNSEELIIHQQLGLIYLMRGYRERALEELGEAFKINRKDSWNCKLISAFSILDMLGNLMEGGPQERRARLFGLASRRSEETAFFDTFEIFG